VESGSLLNTGSFESFIMMIRAGDENAARELVRHYEGVIRREVRLRLEDRGLLRLFDSMDISQSVLTSFFARASSGQFELETPEQLVGLLIGMTRNKLAFQVRRQRARRRDNRLVAVTPVEELMVASPTPEPSQLASDHDLIDAVRHRLKDEELLIVDLRAEGLGWAEVAKRLGGSAQARRMQLARAVHRVAKDLKLEDDRDA
jgi:DNA-directed RNA polymerase specialized sigma24 family protein